LFARNGVLGLWDQITARFYRGAAKRGPP
jgi:hypothetical protein